MRMKQLAYAISLLGIAGATYVHAEEETQKVEKIEITGSSIKRIQKEGALPVQVISKDEITRSGVTSTEALMQSIPSLASAGSTPNSQGSGTSTYGLSAISLRGLGSQRTLVLVNGRRLAASAGNDGTTVNVNSIPLAAIERVEVLKDGASGVYGSDAIAGVVNFILTKNYQGLEIGGSSGAPTTSGGGDTNKAHFVAGFGNLAEQRFNVTVSGSFEKDDILRASDRDYAKTAVNKPYYSGSATGQGNIQGAWQPGVGALPGYVAGGPGAGYGNPAATSSAGCGSIGMFNAGKTSLGAPYCQFDSASYVAMIPQRELTNFTGNFTFQVADSAQLFADALYSKNKIKQSYQNSPLRTSFFDTDSNFERLGVDKALLLRPTNPNYAQAAAFLAANGHPELIGQTLGITARTAGLGNREGIDETTQTRFVAGVKGTIGSYDYEVAAATNQSKLKSTVTNGYFKQAEYVQIINQTNSWNPWAADGLGSAALAQQLKDGAGFVGKSLGGKSKSDSIDAKLAGEIFDLPSGPVSAALGAQTRKDTFILDPSQEYLSGAISGLGGAVTPLNKDRKVNALFGEVVVPVLSNLEATAAVRNDRYNDVGNTTNYKFSMRWTPVSGLLVRASTGSGFRAPTLVDLWYPQSKGTSAGFSDPATNQDNIQVTALTGGNPNLKPEKSKQYTLGFVVAPSSNFSFGVDLFKVKVKDMLATPSVQEIVSGYRAGKAAYQGAVTVDGNNNVTFVKQLTTNLGTADVRGADVDLSYVKKSDIGRFQVTLNGTYMSKFDQTFNDGSISHKVGTVSDENGNPVLGGDLGGVVVRWKHALGVNWSQGPWSAGVTQNFTLGYGDAPLMDGTPHRIPSTTLYDVNAGYAGIKNLTLGVGLKNAFNKQPPLAIYPSQFANGFIYGYDFYQYDPRGRFAYVNASYKFW